MTAPKKDRESASIEQEVPPGNLNPFRLENIFDDVTQIFAPNAVKEASDPSVIIAVDTNVLLLPYTIRKDGLPKLQKFYEDLRDAERLYIPARVAREFIVHRDKKLVDLLKMITDVRSRINIGETKLSPILEGVKGSEAMMHAGTALSKAKEQYIRALSLLEETVESWSGDDPVTSVYNVVFDVDNIVSPAQTNAEILTEWQMRLKEKIPPGYKDGGKDDTGIGDFLVWKSLLALGAAQKKDLIFVTGEEKADWFVRVNGNGVYPRPELVAEYRKHSGGKGLRLVEFHDVLREMDVAQDVVSEVERAELSANTNIRAITNAQLNWRNTVSSTPLNSANTTYLQLRYGGEAIVLESEGVSFKFNVSERTRDEIYIYPNASDALFLIPTGVVGEAIQLDGHTSSNVTISIMKGQIACFRSLTGFVLALRLLSANLPKQNQIFEIRLAFAIFAPSQPVVVP